MYSTAFFYSQWCFYCKAGLDSPADLRKHVGEVHPNSAREAHYREFEQSVS